MYCVVLAAKWIYFCGEIKVWSELDITVDSFKATQASVYCRLHFWAYVFLFFSKRPKELGGTKASTQTAALLKLMRCCNKTGFGQMWTWMHMWTYYQSSVSDFAVIVQPQYVRLFNIHTLMLKYSRLIFFPSNAVCGVEIIWLNAGMLLKEHHIIQIRCSFNRRPCQGLGTISGCTLCFHKRIT